LRPGGVLVYSTCTLFPEENESVVEAFLAENPAMKRTPITQLPDGLRALIGADGNMRTLPHLHDTDGFFSARMERTR
jgi:16S rRNA (cytosine967-C5)-methyltransferase